MRLCLHVHRYFTVEGWRRIKRDDANARILAKVSDLMTEMSGDFEWFLLTNPKAGFQRGFKSFREDDDSVTAS